MNRLGVASSSSSASAAQMPSPEPELDALAIQQAVAFVEFGGVLTIYLASGKRKHDRFFWVDAPALAWDKKRKAGKKPNKHSVIVAVEANAATVVRSGREWFDMIDTDASGQLDATELSVLYKRARGEKLSNSSLKAAMAQLDTDGSGNVSFREFEGWWQANGGDLEIHRENAFVVRVQSGVELVLVAPDVSTKQRWVAGLRAVLVQASVGNFR